jgi:ABC-type hemin transport system ATPase subunit
MAATLGQNGATKLAVMKSFAGAIENTQVKALGINTPSYMEIDDEKYASK